MPDPTTLTQYADQLSATSAAALAAARTRVADARTAEAAARQAVADATAALAAQSDAVSALRKQLAKAQTPADAEALAEDLGKAVIAQRAASGELADAQLAKQEASTTAAQAAKVLAAVSAADAAAKADAAAEKAAIAKRAASIAALGQAPVSEVRGQASDLLADPVFAQAKAKVEADVPQGLRDRAAAQAAEVDDEAGRRQAIASAVQAALDAANEEGGLVGATEPRLRAALDAAAAALQDYVERAATRLQGARGVIERLAKGASVLSDDQRDSLTNAAKQADRDAAVAAEKAADDAAAVARDKHRDLEIAREKFLAADPAGDLAAAEADNTTGPGAAKEAADSADADAAQAAGDVTQDQKDLLAEWRANVPDAAWANLAAFLGAQATLKALATNPSGLKGAVTAGQAALLTALIARAKRDARLAALGVAQAARAAAAGDYASAADARRALALRGVTP